MRVQGVLRGHKVTGMTNSLAWTGCQCKLRQPGQFSCKFEKDVEKKTPNKTDLSLSITQDIFHSVRKDFVIRPHRFVCVNNLSVCNGD